VNLVRVTQVSISSKRSGNLAGAELNMLTASRLGEYETVQLLRRKLLNSIADLVVHDRTGRGVSFVVIQWVQDVSSTWDEDLLRFFIERVLRSVSSMAPLLWEEIKVTAYPIKDKLDVRERDLLKRSSF